MLRRHSAIILKSWPNSAAPTPAFAQRTSKALGAGKPAVASMSWRLVLPRKKGLRLKGGGDSIRLGSFFPLLAWDGSDWARDAPTTLAAAEAWTSPTADFDVRVTQPPGLRVLASGRRVGPGRWQARAVRDFTLAAGRFDLITGTARVPGPVRVTVGVEKTAGKRKSPQAFLRSAIASLQRYSALYRPYPWRTYTMVGMADLPEIAGGLEYPTLVYQPAASENAAHETAHQWFYSLVGNDQARYPWLDEGLATWAESAVNGAPPFERATIPPESANRIGQPMSYWDRLDERRYFLGAYLQSYRALLSLGPRPEVDCALRRYVLNPLKPAMPNQRTIYIAANNEPCSCGSPGVACPRRNRCRDGPLRVAARLAQHAP